MHDFSVVYEREDGSYVIDGGLYHVPNEGEFADLWDEVHRHVTEHPEVVQSEPAVEFDYEIPERDPNYISIEDRVSAVEDGLAEIAEILVEALYD